MVLCYKKRKGEKGQVNDVAVPLLSLQEVCSLASLLLLSLLLRMKTEGFFFSVGQMLSCNFTKYYVGTDMKHDIL